MNTTTDDDGPDLTHAVLFADSNRGVYVPQYFAQNINREYVSGMSDADFRVLDAGPAHEHYWDAWADVLDNATVNSPTLGKCHLHQADGDLWIIPENVPTKWVLGHKFRPFTQNDWYGYAGADKGSYICYVENEDKSITTVLILSPSGKIQELIYEGEEPPEMDDNWRDWEPSDTSKLAWNPDERPKLGR